MLSNVGVFVLVPDTQMPTIYHTTAPGQLWNYLNRLSFVRTASSPKMALHFGRPCLYPLLFLFHSICVSSLNINFFENPPRTYWIDDTCIRKGLTPAAAPESLRMAARGASRLLNINDEYQEYVYALLFKQARDFALENNDATEAWNVIEIEGWIGAMKLELSRDAADVRVYCDNDKR